MRKTITSHFWVGHFPDGRRAGKYFAETYDEDGDDTPVSPFARDQGETWYDHDFLEYGFSKSANSIEKLVSGYSYSEQWAAEVARRVADAGLTGVNMFVFIDKGEVAKPRSVKGDGYWLHYLGTIRYRIDEG